MTFTALFIVVNNWYCNCKAQSGCTDHFILHRFCTFKLFTIVFQNLEEMLLIQMPRSMFVNI